MAFTSSTFSVGPKDSFVLYNKGYNQILSRVKFLSISIDSHGGGGKYPFNNARLWGCSSSNDSNISCAGNNNKYMNGFQVFVPPHPLLLHDDDHEASTSSATKPSDNNNNPSHRGSSAGFFNQDLHDKIVVAVDVDEGISNRTFPSNAGLLQLSFMPATRVGASKVPGVHLRLKFTLFVNG